MEVEIAKKRFTVDEYYRMAQVGILDPNLHTELINGEIVEMTPMGDRHTECVMRATGVFYPAFAAKQAIVSVQNAVRINNITMPQPDLILFRFRSDFYKGKCEAKHVLLLIEVSDTTLRYDRNVKLPLYAAAGIAEVWIEDLQHNRLLVYLDPSEKSFTTSLTLAHGDSVSPLAFPEMKVPIDELLGS